MKTLYGFRVIILTLPFVISRRAWYGFKSICPIPAIDHVIQSRACNKTFSELTDDFGSISGTSGCNSSCSATLFYETSKTKNYMYDIYTTVINNAGNKNRKAPASVKFSADCERQTGNKKRTLYIKCKGMEDNGYVSQHWYRNGSDCLESQDLFGELHVGICFCKKGFFLLGKKCQQGNLPLGTECDDDVQCPGDNRGCSAPDNSSIKICSCNVGYTDIQNICVKSNLTFNVSCIFDEQCNGTTNSGVCNNRMCDCLNGYYYEDQMCYRAIAESATDPQLLQVNYENPDSTLSTGHVVGAAVSGFVLGAGVCLVIFWIMKFRQNRRQHSRSPEVQFANNPSYEKGVKINLNDRAVGTPDGKKVSHVRPVIENDAEYSTVESSKHDNDTVYMYNHLHEKGGEPDLDDYDHAQAITDGMATDEYYTEVGTAHTDREAHDVTDREYAVTTGQQNVDDYFTLERQ